MRSWAARNVVTKYGACLHSCSISSASSSVRQSIGVGIFARRTLIRHAFPSPSGAVRICRSSTLAVEAQKISPIEHHGDNFASTLLALGSCRGCGAAVQLIYPAEAGYYSQSRRAVQSWINLRNKTIDDAEELNNFAGPSSISVQSNEEDVQNKHTDNASTVTRKDQSIANPNATKTPVCDRCHQLLHHNIGVPIHHPSIQSIADTIAESPHKYNHVYHLIDAADFPLSLVPNIQRLLATAPQRSRNRRSKHEHYHRGRKTELSLIITRSDLLAPKKEQVDSLMLYLIEVLRSALDVSGKDVRLGNVRCVSAVRGWWTRALKQQIWERGGGAWMVGKVNVGKSNLFETVFPKGAQPKTAQFDDQAAFSDEFADNHGLEAWQTVDTHYESNQITNVASHQDDALPTDGFLLPPPRPETAFPEMPTISSLPGTTASPIRIPFGNGKGELIDLPGLSRSNLETFVQPKHRDQLVMTSRISPAQYNIKPGQSLLLGGLFCITPQDPDMTILAYPFVPFKAHVTSTHKATEFFCGQRQIEVPMIVEDGVRDQITSAGVFKLQWDVTRQRAGPLTARSALHLKPEVLPFVVLSADILIEGCGWVELVAQVRRRHMEANRDETTEGGAEPKFPEVEILSPQGKFVGIRKPMGAWLLGGQTPLSATQRKSRPRLSKRSAKGSSIRHVDMVNSGTPVERS